MLRNLRLRPTRSVAFQMQTYAVEVVRSRPLRHRIYGLLNEGFRATPTALIVQPDPTNVPSGDPPPPRIEFSQRIFRTGGDFIVEFSAPFSEEFNDEEGLSGSFRVDERLGEVIGFDILGHKLLIIQRFGLATLESAFDPLGFNMQTLVKTFEAIVSGTARVLGDYVIFLTTGGMCRVGRNGRLQLLDIPNPERVRRSWIEDNRYHLQLEDKILVIEKFFDSFFYLSERKVWESDHFMVGYAANRQFIKQIRLRTTADITLTIMNENREQQIQVRGRSRVQTLNVNLRGESFRLRIETKATELQVTDLVAVIGFVT